MIIKMHISWYCSVPVKGFKAIKKGGYNAYAYDGKHWIQTKFNVPNAATYKQLDKLVETDYQFLADVNVSIYLYTYMSRMLKWAVPILLRLSSSFIS